LMKRPEWDPVVVVAQTERLSGPIPACAALLRPRDQVVSPLWLAPSPAALTPVPTGHGLEIPMAFWSATRTTGTSHGSNASIPMGAWCGASLTPIPERQDTRGRERQLVRHPVNSMRRFSSSRQRCIDLTRAFLWVHHKASVINRNIHSTAVVAFPNGNPQSRLPELWCAPRRSTWRGRSVVRVLPVEAAFRPRRERA